MTAYDTAVTTLADALTDAASWGSNHGIPVDEYVSKVAVRVVDAIMAAVNERGQRSCDESNCYCENPHRCGWHR